MPTPVGGGRAGEGKISRGIADGLFKDLYISPSYKEPLPFKTLHFTPDVTQWGVSCLPGSVLEASRERSQSSSCLAW